MLSLYDMIDDEEIVYATYRVHVIFLIGQLLSEIVLLSLTFLAMSLAGDLLRESNYDTLRFIVNLVLSVIAGVLVVSAVIDVVRWYTKAIIVTDRRLIRREGFIQRNIIDITLNRLSQVDFSQSVIGRMLNYGTMTISGGADLPPQEFRNIASPIEFRNTIEDARVGEPPPQRKVTTPIPQTEKMIREVPVMAPAVDAPDRLSAWEKFEDLHQQGFLTDEELEVKRRMLFGELSGSSAYHDTDGDNHDNDDGASARAHSPRSGDYS
ncbi:MAG: PH domain-containing protein [Roseiflexaceae bacterium]